MNARPAPTASLPWRQVHLDFHTSPHIRDVAADFDADEFAQALADAHVNSVTVFAKCHHGHLYFATDRAERHPGLEPGRDLLREQVEAQHARGIRAPIYISVQCDEFAADAHPDWVARDEHGGPIRRGNEPGWQILDMNGPYHGYLVEQVELVLRTFHPVDGIFFDMCWDQPSTGASAQDAMRRAGLDPADPQQRDLHARRVALDYMRRFHAMVKRANPEAGVYFNSRPLVNLAREVEFLEQIEIESLPTGGWGYLYFPTFVRFARNFGRPYLGMTARFHKSWSDFGGLKPQAALEYETAQMIAHGARCSIGDQLHPRGRLDAAAYQRIGRVYERIEQLEPWLDGATPVTQTGALTMRTSGHGKQEPSTDEGVTRMLSQLRHQFDFVEPASDFSRFELIVLPDEVRVDATLAAKLREFLDAGGRLLASATSGLSDDGTQLLFDELGIVPSGFSPFSATYVRFGKRIDRDAPPTDHVMYDRGVRVTPAMGAISLATVIEPYFERSPEHFNSHAQTPPDHPTKFSAAILNGRCAYIAYPIFRSFARHASVAYRQLVGNILEILLPHPVLRATGPTSLETSVLRQGDRTIVHLIYYPAERRAPGLDLMEDVVPLHDVEVSVKLGRAPTRAYLAPQREPLQFAVRDERATVRLPRVQGHAVIVLE